MNDAYLSLGNGNIASCGIFCLVSMGCHKVSQFPDVVHATSHQFPCDTPTPKNMKGPAAVINAAAHVGGERGSERGRAHDTLRE